jgi:hypothetical protein
MAGRPRALDEMKMREICALLSVGCSRNEAAEYVGCSISTIENTIKRDKDFGQRVRRTEMAAEVGMLKQIRDAAPRSWRAAAWALEHLNPGLEAGARIQRTSRSELREIGNRKSELRTRNSERGTRNSERGTRPELAAGRFPSLTHPSSFRLHPSAFRLPPSSFILHPSSFILHRSAFILLLLMRLKWKQLPPIVTSRQ